MSQVLNTLFHTFSKGENGVMASAIVGGHT